MNEIINSLISSVGEAAESAVNGLWGSPFAAFKDYLGSTVSGAPQWLKALNWIIPISDMIAILELWGLAIGIWYVASILLRWLKVIE